MLCNEVQEYEIQFNLESANAYLAFNNVCKGSSYKVTHTHTHTHICVCIYIYIWKTIT